MVFAFPANFDVNYKLFGINVWFFSVSILRAGWTPYSYVHLWWKGTISINWFIFIQLMLAVLVFVFLFLSACSPNLEKYFPVWTHRGYVMLPHVKESPNFFFFLNFSSLLVWQNSPKQEYRKQLKFNCYHWTFFRSLLFLSI